MGEVEGENEPGAVAAPRLPHATGLDGLRAVAVLAVMAYHGGFSWITGGFHGVDIFFVLSGYLITSLLIVERTGTGTVRFGRFWARRARRLLPALFVLVASLALVHLAWPAAFTWADPLPDAAATLGYVANWHFIAGGSSYFSSAAPSPLLHTWSLAIEEQFYGLWPLIVFAVLGGLTRFGHRPGRTVNVRRRLQALGLLCAVGALASAAWMWILTPADASVNRAYYGTDTRAQALLVGATLAVALALFSSRSPRVERVGAASGIVGLLGVAAVVYYIPETTTLGFHGGFLLASVASAAVVAGCVLAPAGPVSKLLSLRPVRYVGTISYGAYLWYWPVDLVMSPERYHVNAWTLFLCRTAVTLGIAAASSSLIEMPIRRGALSPRRALAAIPAAAGLSLALVAGSASAVTAAAAAPLPTLSAQVVSPGAGAHAPSGPSASDSASTAATPDGLDLTGRSGPAVSGLAGQSGLAAVPGLAAVSAMPGLHGLRPTGPPVRVMFVGDSMAGSLGASLAAEAPDYGISIINEGHPGCAVTTDSEFQFLLYDNPPGAPCAVGQPNALLTQWRTWVDQYRPDVVVYLGRVDLMNQQYNGNWTSIGNPAFDAFLQSQLNQGIAILGSRGAKVVLMTSPYYDSSGVLGSVPEDAPGRVQLDDSILTQVASANPGVTLFPLGALVTPDGQYTQTLDGVNVRCQDGVHFSPQAGAVIAPELFPLLHQLAASVHVKPAAGAPALPPVVPSWYSQLQCG
jgi:peptidoglycan/LPS O-acetylase OafA/YrhL